MFRRRRRLYIATQFHKYNKESSYFPCRLYDAIKFYRKNLYNYDIKPFNQTQKKDPCKVVGIDKTIFNVVPSILISETPNVKVCTVSRECHVKIGAGSVFSLFQNNFVSMH